VKMMKMKLIMVRKMKEMAARRPRGRSVWRKRIIFNIFYLGVRWW